MRCVAIVIYLLILPSIVSAQDLTSVQVVQKSIAYHDPGGVWPSVNIDLQLVEERPGAPARQTAVKIDNARSVFLLDQRRGEDHYVRTVENGVCEILFNDMTPDYLSDDEVEEHNLNCAYNVRMRNYYVYLYGLPMKLSDPGTIIHDEVALKDFFGKQLLEVKVTYEEEIGSDTWYFYFHPDSYALSGYRFYHDESKNDGEYILLEGEATVKGMRLPRSRSWYTHKAGEFLGKDAIVN